MKKCPYPDCCIDENTCPNEYKEVCIHMAENNLGNPKSKEDVLQRLNDIGEKLQEAVEARRQEMDAWWEQLPYDDKLRAFYSVVKRIYEGDVVDRRSYRGVLYGTFNFEADSYGIGMECNYLDLHNVIFSGLENEEKTNSKE